MPRARFPSGRAKTPSPVRARQRKRRIGLKPKGPPRSKVAPMPKMVSSRSTFSLAGSLSGPTPPPRRIY